MNKLVTFSLFLVVVYVTFSISVCAIIMYDGIDLAYTLNNQRLSQSDAERLELLGQIARLARAVQDLIKGED